MRSSAIFVAIAAAVVSAQVPTYKSSLNMTIDPNTVAQQQRAVWCQAQTNTCQVLCDNNADENDCNQATLSYDCTCASNSSAPGLQYYTQTLPTFICEQLFSNCIQTNAGNQDGQTACKNNIQKLCATRNPPTAAEISSLDASTAAAETTTSKGAASTHHASATTTAAESASSAAQSSTSKAFAAATQGPIGSGAFAMAAAGLMAYVL
ncbi:uncharacterized protein TRIVIDRAFT_92091 [Trichoderma virens Gv29-8]|uniref:DUF7707 domain-containing protein n=1 Tax=Hypocrea virens (strain Gv29-8 / FGSC 10586) TaxID=413071 RepID=G9MFZ9_HYPVG|nr:uncharacterized protein TRIVIDRAFT_92091 [Trichoderma virens Gv29-8]EHK26450.1 hypothetical protein TRIVIDRAFT_92091 [Trichoderma virens Gv29-8]UKZ46632.1 hypothetical protein TrVGV298_000838 [Trichoderma virens]UKZ73211.1 hypothetical protein TrVFT333_000853 [Trichoderma virens FT-333]